ncbi:alpha/beta hydrolase family protein [Leifsonia xyli]|uniref:alpha/beta hydrolase family protein n=1 Tax=Leifsonia xyli TaxID=1575 RepID=UPI003D66CAA6
MGWFLVAGIAGLAGAALLWAVRRIGDRLARRIVQGRPRRQTRIHGSTATTVTLTADRRTVHRGTFGLWFGEAGHAVVGPVRAHHRADGTVTRELLEVTGDLVSASTGYWTGHLHPGPESLRTPFRAVSIAVPGGTAPAWLFEPPDRTTQATWAIHIHGWNSTRVTALRSVPATVALGMTSLVVSFRGDGEGPEMPGGASTLGLTEWEDVDAAVAYAREHGAQRVVLVGWSLGGAIALQVAERSAHRECLDRIVLISPVTDWGAVIRNGVSERGLPAWTAALAVRTLADRVASARVGLPEPIDFARLDWTRPGRLTLPALVIHSDGDREVPLSSSVLFAMANPTMVRLVELSPAEHSWEYNVDPAAFNGAIIEFLEAQHDLG